MMASFTARGYQAYRARRRKERIINAAKTLGASLLGALVLYGVAFAVFAM